MKKESPFDRENEVLGPSVLKKSEREIINTLHSSYDGVWPSKTELREKVDLSPPVFSENIKNLEEKNYIEINKSEEDGRVKKVKPTEKSFTEQQFFGIPSRWSEKLVNKWQIAQDMRSDTLTEEQKEELKENATTLSDLYPEEVEDIENYQFEDLVEELGAAFLHALAQAAKEFHEETEGLDKSKKKDNEKMLFEAERVKLLKRNLLNGLLSEGGILTSKRIYGGRYDKVLEKLEEKYPFKWERGAP